MEWFIDVKLWVEFMNDINELIVLTLWIEW
jgi:hypothetical protein